MTSTLPPGLSGLDLVPRTFVATLFGRLVMSAEAQHGHIPRQRNPPCASSDLKGLAIGPERFEGRNRNGLVLPCVFFFGKLDVEEPSCSALSTRAGTCALL